MTGASRELDTTDIISINSGGIRGKLCSRCATAEICWSSRFCCICTDLSAKASSVSSGAESEAAAMPVFSLGDDLSFSKYGGKSGWSFDRKTSGFLSSGV